MELYAYRTIAIGDVQPYESNPRTHSEEQVEQLRASIREFGFTNPLLIDESAQLIAGHGRLLAAKAEGLTELPAIVVTGLSDAQRRALVIADNQLAMNAEWDMVRLSAELKSLVASEFDIDVIGFSTTELEQIVNAFVPDAEQPRLDIHVRITCPKCGHEFDRP